MSRERPIIFNGDMVRAILEGRKTMTRRVVKIDSPTLEFDTCTPYWPTCTGKGGDFIRVPCPYGQPGDRLWVRETWGSGFTDMNFKTLTKGAKYKADYPDDTKFTGGKWRPSIHMPRWASRITLEITNVRVERLREIDEEEARAEGFLNNNWATARGNFALLWDEINGPGSWDKNLWVWVIEFKKLTPNL